MDGGESLRPAPLFRQRGQDESRSRRRRRRSARRLAVHPLRKLREGKAAELHRCGAAGDCDSIVRGFRRSAAEEGTQRRDRRIRRDDGRRARERWAGHPLDGTRRRGGRGAEIAEIAETAGMKSISDVRIVLASSSPRRRQLLGLAGIEHVVQPADIDETLLAGELPEGHAERLARAKAETIAESQPEARVIGADTIVVIDGIVLGKPRDVSDAERMLGILSGRPHTVMTAVAVAHGGRTVSYVEQVDVTFMPLGADEIKRYVATGEPMDKAGAYGIQG